MPTTGLTLKGGLTLTSKRSKERKERKKEKKRLKKERKRRRQEEEDEPGDSDGGQGDAASVAPQRVLGTGRLITSGTAVTGQGTKFMDELSNGDAVLITHPTSLQEEVRIVTMVLSNISISLSSPFSSDLISGTRFEFIKKPKEEADEGKERADRKRKKEADDNLAFGTYSGTQTFTYRVRKGGKNASGGWYIKTEKLDKEMSREELLDLRCKQKGDRHAF